MPSKARDHIRDRLLARRLEITQGALTRVFAIDDPTKVGDPEYAVSLEGVVAETIGFGIEAIGGTTAPAIPPSLYSQACLAARNGVSFNVVARRYLAGFLVLTEFVGQEAAPGHVSRLHKHLARLLDELIDEVGEAYAREARRSAQSRESRRARLMEDLLAGDSVDATEVAPDFDFDSWHIGVIATGTNAADTVRELAKASDRRLLQVRRGEHSFWAWFAGTRRIESTKLQRLAAESMPADGCLALGEPCQSLSGWRLSHDQAAAALGVGLRRGDRIVRYGEVSMLAAMLQNPVLSASLRRHYLVPLEEAQDGGQKSRETLRAYFSRDRNMKAAAMALGIARQTVSYRLRAIETRLGCDLRTCAHELEAALDLDRFDRGEHGPGP